MFLAPPSASRSASQGSLVQVIVATLGRLWELVSSNQPHLRDLARLRFLVLDEADR
jgi:superfamily II DNA/RNA helicase